MTEKNLPSDRTGKLPSHATEFWKPSMKNIHFWRLPYSQEEHIRSESIFGTWGSHCLVMQFMGQKGRKIKNSPDRCCMPGNLSFNIQDRIPGWNSKHLRHLISHPFWRVLLPFPAYLLRLHKNRAYRSVITIPVRGFG